MGFLKASQHSLGFHSGEWTYDGPDACRQTRACTGCSNVSVRVRHDVGDWVYRMPRDVNFCTKERRCSRCRLTEGMQEHSFEWRYYDELQRVPTFPRGYKRLRGPCARIMVCVFCPETGTSDVIQHDWTRLVKNPQDGFWYRHCTRCGKVDRSML